jgi:MFS family permease
MGTLAMRLLQGIGKWRDVAGLTCVNALFLGVVFLWLTVGGLIGKQLAPDPRLATVPISVYVAGAALGVVPASYLMRKWGRGSGFLLGALSGVTAGVAMGVAVYWGNFWLLTIAGLFVGFLSGFASYLRFAAMEVAPEGSAGTSASLVLGGGLLSAFLGPTAATFTQFLIAGRPFLGCSLAMIIVSALAAVAIRVTALPVPPPPAKRTANAAVGAPLGRGAFWIAVVGGAGGYALMTFLMNVTPLAMVDICSFSVQASSEVMEVHIVAMFLPFFFAGILIDRIGARAMIGSGFAIFMLSIVVLLTYPYFVNFAVALGLVGLGWSFTYLGGTTLLRASHTDSETAAAQGLNELAIDMSNLVASVAAGATLYGVGWRGFLLIAMALSLGLLGTFVLATLAGANPVRSTD